MDFTIHWTDKSAAHISRHHIEPEEVEEAIEAPYWTFSGRWGTTVLLGCTHAGRYLTVILADSVAVAGACYVATAREMTLSERRTFKRKVK